MSRIIWLFLALAIVLVLLIIDATMERAEYRQAERELLAESAQRQAWIAKIDAEIQ